MLRKVMVKIRLERINIQKGIIVETLLDSGVIRLVMSSEFIRKQKFKLKKIERPNIRGTERKWRIREIKITKCLKEYEKVVEIGAEKIRVGKTKEERKKRKSKEKAKRERIIIIIIIKFLNHC